MDVTMRASPAPVKSTAPIIAFGTDEYGVRSLAALLTGWNRPPKQGLAGENVESAPVRVEARVTIKTTTTAMPMACTTWELTPRSTASTTSDKEPSTPVS
eukprot:scaffold1647_cov102-Isochrysis_galbana.AAC.1